MALISSTTIITSISLFHLAVAFFLLTNPQTISDQALVWVLGESMGMPEVNDFNAQNPALALVSVVLALIGLSDLVSLSMPEEIWLVYYWSTQAPFRALFSLILTFYIFFFGPSSPAYQTSSRGMLSHPSSFNPAYTPSGWGGDGLKNRVVFTLIFVEMVAWFWTWITVREERSDFVARLKRDRS